MLPSYQIVGAPERVGVRTVSGGCPFTGMVPLDLGDPRGRNGSGCYQKSADPAIHSDIALYLKHGCGTGMDPPSGETLRTGRVAFRT
jgi:hypothetical protein